MTDQLEKLFAELRAESLAQIVPPGAERARRTVRRRRAIAASGGTAVAVIAVLSAVALLGPRPPDNSASASSTGPATASSSPRPHPSPPTGGAPITTRPADPASLPHVMATAGEVTADYENDVNDIPADDYILFVSCTGRGTVDVEVKAGNSGDTVLAAGTVNCADDPVPGQLPVTQPVSGYLRVFLSGDKLAAGHAGFSFSFVRTAEIVPPASAASAANATTAARLLTHAGIPGAKAVTTERDRSIDEHLAAGNYLASFACAGPGKVSFIIRSGKVLRDGTVATGGPTETAVSYLCTAVGKLTKDVAMPLPAGSAFTITAQTDSAARNQAGWAYAFRRA